MAFAVVGGGGGGFGRGVEIRVNIWTSDGTKKKAPLVEVR